MKYMKYAKQRSDYIDKLVHVAVGQFFLSFYQDNFMKLFFFLMFYH